MIQKTQIFCGFYTCILVASVWAALMLMTAHAFSPNTDHQYERGTQDSHLRNHSHRPFQSVMQPEFTSARKTHKHTSMQPTSRSAKTMMRKSTTLFDWEQQALQIAMELRERIESGFRYQHRNNHANHHDHAIDAVFVGYRFTVEERQRMRSAHVDDCLTP